MICFYHRRRKENCSWCQIGTLSYDLGLRFRIGSYDMKTFELPEENSTTVDAERCRCTTGLFQPVFTDNEARGIHIISFQNITNTQHLVSTCTGLLLLSVAGLRSATLSKKSLVKPKRGTSRFFWEPSTFTNKHSTCFARPPFCVSKFFQCEVRNTVAHFCYSSFSQTLVDVKMFCIYPLIWLMIYLSVFFETSWKFRKIVLLSSSERFSFGCPQKSKRQRVVSKFSCWFVVTFARRLWFGGCRGFLNVFYKQR